MIDAPPASLPDVLARLGPVMDLEGKLRRSLVDLGMPPTCGATVLDVPGTDWVERLCEPGGQPTIVTPDAPFRVDVPAGSQDAVVTLWNGFRGVEAGELAEADRVLRPGGRLLVVHDYGRDDVSALRAADLPEFTSWSRREGPFLRDAGFKIRVVHCFWTFPSIDEARERLASLGDRGEAVAATIRKPRLSWNVAIYHRTREAGTPVPG
jgi:hypothetical protein